MARYDRIAQLPAPPREQAFPAWGVLLDLEGRERDADLGRRARLRFLALRPVLRLLEHGVGQVPDDSFQQQLEEVRRELDQLPARDAERARLASFLDAVAQRTPLALVTATLDLGAVAEEARHHHAAEEFVRAALDLATQYRLVPEQVIALRLLGRVHRAAGDLAQAERHYRASAALALELGDRGQWLRAIEGLAAVLRDRGALDQARNVLRHVLQLAREWQDPAIHTAAVRGLIQNELGAGYPDTLLDRWAALATAVQPATLDALVARLEPAFMQAGLPDAGDSARRVAAIIAAADATRSPAIAST